MLKELTRLSRLLSGNVLSIGFDENSELLKRLQENKKLKNVFTLTNRSSGVKNNGKKSFGDKTLNIKKIKKVFKSKRIDYMFIELSSVEKYLHTVVKNSIDITNKNIYIALNDNKFDEEVLMKRYTRYGCTCSIKGNILTVDCNKIKTNIFKNIIFTLGDINYDLQELLAFVLIGS